MKQDMLPQSTRVLHVSITIRTGRAGHQRKPMRRFFLSVIWNWIRIPHRAARAYLVYFTQSWRSLPSMFVFGTIEDTPNIIRTRCNCRFAETIMQTTMDILSLHLQRHFWCVNTQNSNQNLYIIDNQVQNNKTNLLMSSKSHLTKSMVANKSKYNMYFFEVSGGGGGGLQQQTCDHRKKWTKRRNLISKVKVQIRQRDTFSNGALC